MKPLTLRGSPSGPEQEGVTTTIEGDVQPIVAHEIEYQDPRATDIISCTVVDTTPGAAVAHGQLVLQDSVYRAYLILSTPDGSNLEARNYDVRWTVVRTITPLA